MKCFLTSSTSIPGTEELNPANGLADRLRASAAERREAVFICSDPNSPERTDRFAQAVKASLEAADLSFSRFVVLDGRNRAQAGELLHGADLIVLAGGHVPTQNRFFAQLGLKELLHAFDGVLVGISAGSMNCAELVYAQPELEGEAMDPNYRRFLPGLGLTKKMLLPHYQAMKDDVLDGLRVMEDIAYPDSLGREFFLLPDGSYLYIDDSGEEICGEAYRLADGKLQRQIHQEKTQRENKT